MKLNVDYSRLESLVTQMGAKPVAFSLKKEQAKSDHTAHEGDTAIEPHADNNTDTQIERSDID